MRVEEFLSTMDALRFDTELDETNPELRGMVTKVYPYLRKIYNMMYESGMITEAHGVKKHNTPKDKRAAERKGNRDAEKDMFGDGFKPKNKIHKIKNYNRRDNKKVSIEDNDMNESKNIVRLSESELKNMVQESVKRIVKESYMDIPDANKTFDSDNDYITVSVPSDKFGELKHQMGVKMKELGYVYQDVGQSGNKAMITYRRIGI